MTTNLEKPIVAAGDKYWVVGDLYTFHVTGNESGGAYAAVETPVAPGNGTPPHTHSNEDEAFHILEGEIEFHTQGKIIVATAGSVVHAPKGVQHCYRNASTKPARMMVWIVPAGFEVYFAEIGTAMQNPGEAPPDVDFEKLMRLAPEYGLTIDVPAQAPV